MPCSDYQSWRNWTRRQHWRSSAKPSTSSPVERHQEGTVCHRKSWSAGSLPSSSRFTSSSVNAGLMDTSHKTWDASIVTPYKNKGDWSDCSSFRSISLFRVVDKVFARVRVSLSKFTQSPSAASESAGPQWTWSYPSDSCKRSVVSSSSHCYSLSWTWRKPDLVSRSVFFQILQKIGCLPKPLAFITAFHEVIQSTVWFDGATTDAFLISRAAFWHQVCSGFSSRCYPSMPLPITRKVYTFGRG